jgi:DNA-binding MarR family transcriptional regulator
MAINPDRSPAAAAGAPPVPAADVIDVASRLRLAITRMARRMRQEAGTELTPSQIAALATVERHGPLTPSELAELERVRRPSATRVLNRLLELELIERQPDPADRRSALLSMSPSGRTLLRRLRGRKNAYLARRLRGLDAEDLATLERAADVIERMLEGERA